MSEGETPDTERVTTLAAIEPGRPQPFLPTGRSITVDDLLEFPEADATVRGGSRSRSAARLMVPVAVEFDPAVLCVRR
ncbi:hypothetical protein AB0J43_26505 [Nonomuraea fuscirosea]